MKKFKIIGLMSFLSVMFLVGCTPAKVLTPSEMILPKKGKYEKMESSQGLSGWEKGIWEYEHKNYKKALELLEPYKDKNIGRVDHAYGYMYNSGYGGLGKDINKAAEYYVKSIKESNYPPSLNNLGALYIQAREPNKAFVLYTKSAEQGYAVAQGNLAAMYEASGKPKKALELYLKAAKNGDASAQCRLGKIYRYGHLGVSSDYGKSFYWLQQADNQDYPEAAYEIGMLYQFGFGVDKNLHKAVSWFKRSKSLGDFKGASSLIYIRKKYGIE